MALFDYITSQLMRELSQNSRQSFNGLGKKLGVSGSTVKRRLSKLEKEYGIKYVLEIDTEALGLVANHIILVKLKKVPPIQLLQKIFKKYPEAQYAALTKGDFDLFIYASASNHEDLSRWAHWTRQQLSEYVEYWGPTNVIGNWFGFFPLRDEMINKLSISESKKTILKLLNRNARTSLKELSNNVGLSMPTTQYHLKQLMKSKYVKRFTIVMTKPPKNVQYIVTWGYNILNNFMKYGVASRNFLVSTEKEGEMSSLVLASNTIGVTDDVVIKAFDTIKEAQEFDEGIAEVFGPVIREHNSAFIVEDLVGYLPARNLDTKSEYHGEWNIYDYLKQQ